MKFFYDCEFLEDGRVIDLLSVGMVAENGEEFYAVSTECDLSQANQWVRENVLPKLPPLSDSAWCSRAELKDRLWSFIETQRAGTPIELWAWVGCYDHVAIAQLWGDMRSFPRSMPRFTHELRQFWESAGCPELPEPPQDIHNALADARSNLQRYYAIKDALSSF